MGRGRPFFRLGDAPIFMPPSNFSTGRPRIQSSDAAQGTGSICIQSGEEGRIPVVVEIYSFIDSRVYGKVMDVHMMREWFAR